MTVSIYSYVAAVLTLLGLLGVTVFIAIRRIEELRAALIAKDCLLGTPSRMGGIYHLPANDTLKLCDDTGHTMLEITPNVAVALDVRPFRRINP